MEREKQLSQMNFCPLKWIVFDTSGKAPVIIDESE